MKICLVIIFNHRFDTNIDLLKIIYHKRFDCIKFLVPFYDGDDMDVIPVYECSYQFQGYLIQAYEKLVTTNADYYFFIADDMIIHPELNQDNLIDSLGMNEKDIFISDLCPLNDKNVFNWSHSKFSSIPFLHKATSWKESMIDINTAVLIFEHFFEKAYNLEYDNLFFGDAFQNDIDEFIKNNGGTRSIPFPMAVGYSDIFIISKQYLYSISRIAGIFSAMNLFVEIAIPTAIVLSVRRDKVVFINQTKYISGLKWGDEIMAFESQFNKDLQYLISKWEKDVLFYHPVKLSRWDVREYLTHI